jgi:hypothetical protein
MGQPIIARAAFILGSSSEHYTDGSEERRGMTTRTLLLAGAGLLLGAATLAAADKRITEKGLGKVLVVETVTIVGKVTYEAQVVKNGKKSELEVDVSAKAIEH